MSNINIGLKWEMIKSWQLIFANKTLWWTIFSYMLISIPYMFRAAMCPSSEESIVSMRHQTVIYTEWYITGVALIQLILLMMGAWFPETCNSDLHTRRSSIQSGIYQVSHWYNLFFWWWAHGYPKHVENRNTAIRKNCASIWFICKDYTKMHGQQYIKKTWQFKLISVCDYPF